MKHSSLKLLALFFIINLFSFTVNSQPGSFDNTFNTADIGHGAESGTHSSSPIYTSALQSDSKIVIGGDFETYGGYARKKIARILTDGSLDTTFHIGTGIEFIGTGGGSDEVRIICIQSDGKILVAGFFDKYNGVTRKYIARLNIDGSLDATFDPGTGPGTSTASAAIRKIALQSDGKILVVGDFNSFNGVTRNDIVRLNTDGSVDLTFSPSSGTGLNGSLDDVILQPDGKILVGGAFSLFNGSTRNCIARINSDGSLDNSFNPGIGANQAIYGIAIQPDGKVLVCGLFTALANVSRNYVGRLNSDGTLDLSFNPGTGANAMCFTIYLKPDGKILIGGLLTTYDNMPAKGLAQLLSNGSLDATFNTSIGVSGAVRTFVPQSSGMFVIAGGFTKYDLKKRFCIARVFSDGSLDHSFLPFDGADDDVFASQIQNDGKIIIAGRFTTYNEVVRNQIARLNIDGSLDMTFNPPTTFSNFPVVNSMLLQNDGKIIVTGSDLKYFGTPTNVVRFNSDGTQDISFVTNISGFILTSALQSDGKIVIGGSFSTINGVARNNIARLNSDGTLDLTFNPGTGPNHAISTLDIQNDGKIIICSARMSIYNGTTIYSVARLNTDGSLDMTFDPGTGIDYDDGEQINACKIQPDGKILIGGGYFTFNQIARRSLTRLNSDGSVDLSFNVGTGVFGAVYTFLIENTGKIVMSGFFSAYNGTTRRSLARLNSDGSIDNSFYQGTGVFNYLQLNAGGEIRTTSFQADGKIIIGGRFSSVHGEGRNNVARLLGDESPVLNLKAYISGYYIGGGLMQSTLFNNGNSADPLSTDTVEIDLHENIPPYTIIHFDNSIIKKNGQLSIPIPESLVGNSYYIALKHRNSLETWSSIPISFSGTTNYDFTTAPSQAYGSNMIETFDQQGWAFYSGDISNALTSQVGVQDGVIESQDYGDMENAVGIILTGYVIEDITGDGVVESSDYSIMENNVSQIIFIMRP